MSAGRRGNGEGTITQRADGSWAAAVLVGSRRKWSTARRDETLRRSCQASVGTSSRVVRWPTRSLRPVSTYSAGSMT
jgi:hypothetical protein